MRLLLLVLCVGCRFGFDNTPTVEPWTVRLAVDPPSGTTSTVFSFEARVSPPTSDLTIQWDFDEDGALEGTETIVGRTFDTTGVKTISVLTTHPNGRRVAAEITVVVVEVGRVLTVDSTEDVIDQSDGLTTLREAVEIAALSDGADVITFEGPMVVELTEELEIHGDDTTIMGGDGVIIDGSAIADQNHDCLEIRGDRVQLLYLEIRSCVNDGVRIAGGKDTWVAHCSIHDSAEGGVEIDDGDRTRFGPGNRVFDNGEDGASAYGIDMEIFDNHFVDNGQSGFYVTSSGRVGVVTLRGNVIARNDRHGISLSSTAETSLEVVHNTLVGNRDSNLRLGSAATHSVLNNVLADAEVGILDGERADAVDHNCYFDNVTGDCPGCVGEIGAVDGTGTQFVDRAADDFGLLPGSPCIDAGADLGLDRNGNRPGNFDGAGPDIGAHEG